MNAQSMISRRAAIARRENRSPWAVAYDLLLKDEGRRLIYVPFYNYAGGDLETVRAMMEHPRSVLGLSDGGGTSGNRRRNISSLHPPRAAARG